MTEAELLEQLTGQADELIAFMESVLEQLQVQTAAIFVFIGVVLACTIALIVLGALGNDR